MENSKKRNMPPEVKDEELDAVSGGVQAGSILKGGEGEFGENSPERKRAEREKQQKAERKKHTPFL